MVFYGTDSPKDLDEVGQARKPGARDHDNKAWQQQQLTYQQRVAEGDNPEGINRSNAPHFGGDHIVTAEPTPPNFFSSPAGMGAMAVGAITIATLARKAIRK